MSLKKFKSRNKENKCAISGKLLENPDQVVSLDYNGTQVKVEKKYVHLTNR